MRFERTGIMDTITVVIYGRVVDIDNGNNIAAVLIKLKNDTLSYFLLGDSIGKFKFNHIQAGLYNIEVSALGYFSKDTIATMGTGGIWEWKFGLARWDEKTRKQIIF